MSALEIAFWCLVAFVGYTYVFYPLALAVCACVRRPTRPAEARAPASVSVIVAAFNEDRIVERRLKELTGLVATTGVPGEVILVSDGSTDRTAEIGRGFADAGVRVLELPRGGKAAALTAGAAAARHEVLVFADARQRWAPDALVRLLENFADPTVGAASGDLVVESAPGVMAGVGAYWRYEKLLRRLESRVGSTVGVSGSISAVRRDLFRPIPPGTLLDDVYWPLRVAMQGYRVVHDERAHAYDRLPDEVRNEFRRKVRTLSGNYQLLARLTAALVPWRNPVWLQFLSHKVFRLLVPWALIALLAVSAVQPGAFYQFAFCAQAVFYGFAVLGLRRAIAARIRLASAAASFVVLNAAAWLAWWTWATGRASRSWTKVAYS
ncbi:MAG TPA: glycosyltransferase [Gemmataceae bacterium]|nr:glycosyltransferase [Gemmataceae bacterium]